MLVVLFGSLQSQTVDDVSSDGQSNHDYKSAVRGINGWWLRHASNALSVSAPNKQCRTERNPSLVTEEYLGDQE